MTEAVIIALITACVPGVVTIVTALIQHKTNSRNAAKQSILQMIMEDRLDVLYGGMATNYQNILHEFDIYTKNGGNSYVAEKVEEYKKWFKHLEGEKHGN